jgi:hypothetical protein
MRAQRREFWGPVGPRLVTPAGIEDLQRVLLPEQLTKTLQQQMYVPARARGGLLFGYGQGDSVQVLLAITVGAPNWYAGGSRTVLELNPRLTLGWSEALFGLLGGRVDWCGNWIAHPNSQLKSVRRDLRSFRQDMRLGLFDDRSVLLVVGWEESQFSCRAYRRGPDAQVLMVPFVITRIGLPELVSALMVFG